MFNHPQSAEPRASRITVPIRPRLYTELWMGGANSLHGELLLPADLRDAWVIDLAGDLPDAYRVAAACWLARVFADVEQVPYAYDRLAALAVSIAACLRGAQDEERKGWPHPAIAPARLYIMCQQGMNRSGLLTGLILRALGVASEAALTAVASRPGALTNQTYVRLVREWPAIDAAG
jgi:hypothetical protein